ncbi:MAG: caspase family protein [Elusimicrobia bacterium]|nr:caspase family protein [Elusimicrobiota bacterium]
MNPSVLFLAAALLAAAPARGDDYRYRQAYSSPQQTRVYVMPPATYYEQQQRWSDYQYQHQQAQRWEQDRITQATWQSLQVQPVFPGTRPGAEPRRPPPYHGPTKPPEMSDSNGIYAQAIKDYVEAHSQGDFVVDDSASGRRYQLRLTNVRSDSVRRLPSGEMAGCADFETTSEPKQALDLDFFLSDDTEDWSWQVKKILVHGVNGQLRYAYDSSNQIVAAAPAKARTSASVPKPSAPARLSAEVALKDFTGDGVLAGGDTGRLSVKVSNAGPGPAYAIRLALETLAPVSGLEIPPGAEFGDLKPGQSVEKEVALSAAEGVGEQKLGLRLSLREGNGFDTEPVVIDLRTVPAKPPRLEVTDIGVGRGGQVQAGEPTEVSVRVRNAGAGPAEGVEAVLNLGSADIFMSGEAKAALGTLSPGQVKTAAFEFFANKRFKNGQTLPVSLTVTESKRRYGLEAYPLRLVVGKSAPMVTVVASKGKPAEPAAAPVVEDVDAPPAARTPRDPDAYAVVIGIEKYRDLPAAEFAARDARSVYAYLTEAMGFDPKNVVMLQNERATLTDMVTYLGSWLADHATAKSRVFVYFSGHGAPDPKSGQAHLIPYDGDPAYADSKAFSLQRLYEALGKLPTDDVFVALDSCFSGAGGRSLIAQGTRPLITVDQTSRLAANMVLLAAAGPDQISTSEPETQHGMLTYFLLKGLRGEADADGDSRLTTRELFAYLQPAVEREARKRHVAQTPTLTPPADKLGSKGERVWLRLK